jgi:hydrogenase nickel incorporation protein HypA/HybF
MHELSLMAELIKVVSEDARDRGIIKVSKIDVIVGDLSNVLPEALEEAFIYLRPRVEAPFDEQTELHIIREEARAACRSCGTEFVPDYRIAFCPVCRLPTSELQSGETFRVESYEGCDEDGN